MHLKKYSAISQAIAVILLIGLTVIAGAALFIVILPILNNNQQVLISTSKDAKFSTTESNNQLDSLIDTMSFQVSNELNVPIKLDLVNYQNQTLYDVTRNAYLYNWYVTTNNTERTLTGQESGLTITYKTAGNINQQEISYGDQVYALMNVTILGKNDWTIVKSNVYTVSKINVQPAYTITNPVSSLLQSGDNVQFSAYPNQSVTNTLSVIVWNLGSPYNSSTKRISIFLENETFFQINSQYQSQTITIPASTHIGFGPDNGNSCPSGYPCVEVKFPITLIAVDTLGYTNGINTSYGALVSLSGLNFVPYTLNIAVSKNIGLFLPNSLVAPGTGNGRIANSNLIYNGPFNANNSLDLTITVWNNETQPLIGNMYLSGLNTTAFSLDSPNITSIYIPAPTGPLPTDLSTCNSGEPCTTVTWTITRLPLKNGNTYTGVAAGAYNIMIRFLEYGNELPVVLYINGPGSENSPYIYVNSITWSTNTNKNTVSSSVEIWDENFNVISGATVSAQWVYPNGATVSLSGTTNSKGIATFTQTLAIGTNTLKIQNVSATGKIYLPSDNKVTNNGSSYIVNNNYIYVQGITFSYTTAKGSNPASLSATVTVYDQNNQAIKSVSVDVIWNYPNGVNSSIITATTNNKGEAVFSNSSLTSGTYTIYISSLSLTGYDYKYSSNVVFSAQYASPLFSLQLNNVNKNNIILYKTNTQIIKISSTSNQILAINYDVDYYLLSNNL